ncbi:MAG: T9SS type A sorting domain-containing protein [candidate division Zixibacteria bacterium]|nr:T9SS type A sorting domain-containing protein [candidate division Zixibacteria bacterium]
MKFYIRQAIILIVLFSLFSLSAFADEEESEFYNFIKSQFKNLSSSSSGTNSSSSDSNFVVEIGLVENVALGTMVDVPVTLRNAPWDLYGFDLLFSFDPAALTFIDVIPGIDFFDPDSGCGWVYFDWRQGSSANCGSSPCPTGIIRVVGIPDIGYPHGHPSCLSPETPASFFSLRFLVTNDFTYKCSLIPVRFVWYDCIDNAVAFFSENDGEEHSLSLALSDDVYSGDILNAPSDHFPSYGGVTDSCTSGLGNFEFSRVIDFHNGGIFIQCDDTEPVIGDINLDGVWNVTDLSLFIDYFIIGESVFEIDPSEQIAATDINKDGETLKLEDLVQLSNMIFNALDPDSTIDSTLDGSIVNNDKANKTVSLHTDYFVDAIWIKMSGDIEPYHPIDSSLKGHFYDGSHTRILFWSYYRSYGPGNVDLFYYTGEGEIVEAQAATNVGVEITLRIDDVVTSIEEPDDILPSAFALHQNYPNPFNIETVIEFDLPRASEVEFEIINILGQLVYNVTDRFSAGSHTIYWDGSTNSGQTVGSGVYYYRITAGDFVSSKKMVLLK